MNDESDNGEASGQPVDASMQSTLVSELDAEEAGIIAAYDRLSWRWKVVALLVIIGAVAVLLGIWHDVSFRWFEIHTGTVNESGPYYGFWSGFGSDVGEATLIAGLLAAWRHHSCHVRGCVRLGRRVEGTPYLACPRHHPEHKGSRRTVTSGTDHQLGSCREQARNVVATLRVREKVLAHRLERQRYSEQEIAHGDDVQDEHDDCRYLRDQPRCHDK